MKTQGLRLVPAVVLGALLLLTSAGSSQAGEFEPGPAVSFDLDIHFPTPNDEIEMTIFYALPDGCYEVDEGQPVQVRHDITVPVQATEVLGPCLPGSIEETFQRIIGPLERGEYNIGAEVNVDYLCQGIICESESIGLSTTVQVADVGDANCDGTINSIDANMVLQHSAGFFTLLCPQGGDTNVDGEVQSIDAALILQYDAGLLGQLPPA